MYVYLAMVSWLYVGRVYVWVTPKMMSQYLLIHLQMIIMVAVRTCVGVCVCGSGA